MTRLNKTLLLTGCTGFIGAHVTKQLLEEGYTVYAIVRSRTKLKKVFGEECHNNLLVLEGDLLNNLETLQHEISTADDFDGVVHMVGGGPLTINPKFTTAIFDLNYKTTCNLVRLLEATHKLDALSLFVHFSSLAAMGIPGSQGDTVLYNETIPCEPVLPYEHAKLQTENFLRTVTDKYNFKTVVLRFPQVYGDDNEQFSQLIRLIQRGVFPVVRNRIGTLPLLHVSDAAKATRIVVRDYNLIQSKYDVNLVSENSYSYDDLKELVRRRYGTGHTIKLPYVLLYLVTVAIECVFKVFGKAEPLNRRRLSSMTKNRVVDCGKFLHTFNFQFDHGLTGFMSDGLA